MDTSTHIPSKFRAPAAVKKPPHHDYPNASSPLRFSMADWKEILVRVKNEVTGDRIGMIAAAVAFYAMFAIFPLLIATVSIYGIFSNPLDVQNQIQAISRFIPRDAAGLIETQLSSIVQNSSKSLGFGAIFSLLVTVWTGSKGTKSLMEAMNIAYDEKEKRGFIKLNATALILTLGAVLTVVSAVAVIAILPPIMDLVGLKDFTNKLILVLRWPLLFALFSVGLGLLNCYAPSRTEPKWKWVSVGATVATLLILLASLGFAYYVERFGDYNKTYGSLAGVIVLLFWLYMVSYAVLFGAELNAEIEHQTIADSTVGPSTPMGERGAVKADTTPT